MRTIGTMFAFSLFMLMINCEHRVGTSVEIVGRQLQVPARRVEINSLIARDRVHHRQQSDPPVQR